ncbi:hypothetical protein [Saccharolobus caldissimus]|uniref:Uncharacterized protein n=1 Tax=Saccharolobus caldissimus TaxID=1702097 RepID=A0AAQ4CVM0_9CREN|nr:hypothetical protein [Saccharolobus caldissimus]BDB99851.1 hypothetical protein SACC_28680 [Saccharolobus caldissimus]
MQSREFYEEPYAKLEVTPYILKRIELMEEAIIQFVKLVLEID